MKMLADTSLQIVSISDTFPKTLVVFGPELNLVIFEKMIELRKDSIDFLEKCMLH